MMLKKYSSTGDRYRKFPGLHNLYFRSRLVMIVQFINTLPKQPPGLQFMNTLPKQPPELQFMNALPKQPLRL